MVLDFFYQLLLAILASMIAEIILQKYENGK